MSHHLLFGGMLYGDVLLAPHLFFAEDASKTISSELIPFSPSFSLIPSNPIATMILPSDPSIDLVWSSKSIHIIHEERPNQSLPINSIWRYFHIPLMIHLTISSDPSNWLIYRSPWPISSINSIQSNAMINFIQSWIKWLMIDPSDQFHLPIFSLLKMRPNHLLPIDSIYRSVWMIISSNTIDPIYQLSLSADWFPYRSRSWRCVRINLLWSIPFDDSD